MFRRRKFRRNLLHRHPKFCVVPAGPAGSTSYLRGAASTSARLFALVQPMRHDVVVSMFRRGGSILRRGGGHGPPAARRPCTTAAAGLRG